MEGQEWEGVGGGEDSIAAVPDVAEEGSEVATGDRAPHLIPKPVLPRVALAGEHHLVHL